ncbi:hypothetical protein CHCC14821_2567 [Bacillus paralicheniformis]|nr:hypothetical protein CHCC14821_2567 [Bacillus paralicheniformis]
MQDAERSAAFNKELIAYQREMGFSAEKRDNTSDVSNDDRPDQDQVLFIKEL